MVYGIEAQMIGNVYAVPDYGSSSVYVDGPPVGSQVINVVFAKSCVCGDAAMEDSDGELCAACWVHSYTQDVIDAVLL